MTQEEKPEGKLEDKALEMLSEGRLEEKALEMVEQSQERRYVNQSNLEEELKNVHSHLVLPKGEYHIDFDIEIQSQGTLEVEPGAEIYFGKEAGILSYGTLKAEGTEEENILFTAENDSWRNITIAGKESSDSALEYCIVSKGSGRK